MPIDVPYSFLVRQGDYAWSCGQLALDKDSQVLCPNDLAGQSHIICNNVEQILQQGTLPADSVRRLILYFCDANAEEKREMVSLFKARFSDTVVIDVFAVPWFYYDGVMLEVDVFCGVSNAKIESQLLTGGEFTKLSDGHHTWVSVSTNLDHLRSDLDSFWQTLSKLSESGATLLTEHWLAPPRAAEQIAVWQNRNDLPSDLGSIINNSGDGQVHGHFLLIHESEAMHNPRWQKYDSVLTCVRQAGDYLWVKARSTSADVGLVQQTREIMQSIESTLTENHFQFTDVVKSTTHYTGGNSANELHDNMQVRNRYYQRPGPASTGLPVFGFADNNSKIVVDVLALKNS